MENDLIVQRAIPELDLIQSGFRTFENKTIEQVVEEFLSLKNSEQTKRAYRSDVLDFFYKLKNELKSPFY